MIPGLLRHATPLLGLALLVACGDRTGVAGPQSENAAATTESAADALRTGPYRATLQLPGGELPFGLEIARESGGVVAWLVNGRERIRVPEVQVQGDRIEMRMPGFMNRLTARIAADGALAGEVVLVKRDDKNQHIPFEARAGQTWRFAPQPPPAGPRASVEGRWAVTFTEDSGRQYAAVGEFSQAGHEVTGTFLTPTGDHRYLAGELHGEELKLSTFDGARAYLYRARLTQPDRLEGTYWSGLAWKERFVATRDAKAALGEEARKTAMRAGATRLDFSFPDLDGRPVALSDPRFAGKVVIVALAGSWCGNCHDEAEFLARYHRENRARGIEVVSLMFEHFGDFERAAAATRRFRERYGIEYATLIAGISDKDDAATRLPQLTGVYAFPTTIFIDRSGRVRKIHTGFAGPATGEHHRRLLEQFDATVRELLAES